MNGLILCLLVACTVETAPNTSTIQQGLASVVGSYVDPTGLHVDASITMPGGAMPTNGWPLVIPFHRLSGVSTEALSRLGFGTQANWPQSPIADRAIILWPNGTKRPGTNTQFWNATPACCDQSATGVDDIGYIEGAYSYMIANYTIDSSKVIVIGLSNGGFMAEALMCKYDHYTRALDASGGAPKPCVNADGLHTVSIFKDHGDNDTTIFWNSTTPISNTMTLSGMHDTYPDADDASQYGCTSFTDSGVTKDYESTTGSETHVLTSNGCPTGVSLTLYRAYGGIHSPSWITSHWQADVLTYLGI